MGPLPVSVLQVHRFMFGFVAAMLWTICIEVWCMVRGLAFASCDQRMSLAPSRQEKGIAASDIKKLEDGGVYTVEALAHGSKRELSEIKGLSEAKIEKM